MPLSIHPCLPCWPRRAVHQGPVAPRTLLRFPATTGLTATVSPSADFPVSPVIRPTLLQRFLAGARTVSPVAQHVLATVLSLPPRRSSAPPRLARDRPCCLRPTLEGLGLRSCFCRGHLWVHSRYGPVTHSPSQGWLGWPASSASFGGMRVVFVSIGEEFASSNASETQEGCCFDSSLVEQMFPRPNSPLTNPPVHPYRALILHMLRVAERPNCPSRCKAPRIARISARVSSYADARL